jgi:hypothetical protein
MHRVHSGMSPHGVRVLFRKQKYKLQYNITPKSYGVYPFFLPTCCWSLRFRSCAMSDNGWDGYMAPGELAIRFHEKGDCPVADEAQAS